MHAGHLALPALGALLPLLPAPSDPRGAWLGTWDRVTRFRWDGKWHEERGRAVRDWVLGGRFLRETQLDANGATEGLRYVGWDPDGRRSQLVIMDAMSPRFSLFEGAAAGDGTVTWEGEDTFPWAAEPLPVRLSVTSEGADAHTLRMWAGAGDAEQLILEVRYTRRPASPTSRPEPKRAAK